ncbi:PH domain-containing protein [Salibacterium halotolerans]|uniref:Putative membrane protein n=1 Tax=Salibacterium halotolerans TaxID=1884432 RepID=A0A1I5S3S0_9BACI|nr:PH domain-containing protein [Salibacterium halotolerans]SFP64916.1 putative membrane protein [Salibacterium halotolerans]
MTQAKRYHPLVLVFQLKNLIRNMILIGVYLFVFNAGSNDAFYTYARYIFIGIIGLTALSYVYKWFTHTYKLDTGAFQLYKGLFAKSRRTVPFSKIQNVQRHTSWLHRLLGMTSITFETSMEDNDDSVTFRALPPAEADRLEDFIKQQEAEAETEETETDAAEDSAEMESSAPPAKTVHFRPGMKDHIKASFLSLSFFALIPVIFSLVSNVDSTDTFTRMMESGFVSALVDAWWKITLIAVLFASAAVIFGAVKTILQYGRYEIASDDERIYITKGFFQTSSFSVQKSRVQAVEYRQPPINRWLGMTEMRLISAGGANATGGTENITSLYPYMSTARAAGLIEDILPVFSITDAMTPLPRRSLFVRFLRPSWFWLIATGLLFYFEPSPFDIHVPWWALSAVLLVLVIISRLLDFAHTRYAVHDECIQWRKGGWTTFLFVTKREKVSEMTFKRGILQKPAGLSTMVTINRSNPVKHTDIDDIPVDAAGDMKDWYSRRTGDIITE